MNLLSLRVPASPLVQDFASAASFIAPLAEWPTEPVDLLVPCLNVTLTQSVEVGLRPGLAQGTSSVPGTFSAPLLSASFSSQDSSMVPGSSSPSVPEDFKKHQNLLRCMAAFLSIQGEFLEENTHTLLDILQLSALGEVSSLLTVNS